MAVLMFAGLRMLRSPQLPGRRIEINPTTMVSLSRTRVTRSTSIEPEGEGEDDVPPHVGDRNMFEYSPSGRGREGGSVRHKIRCKSIREPVIC